MPPPCIRSVLAGVAVVFAGIGTLTAATVLTRTGTAGANLPFDIATGGLAVLGAPLLLRWPVRVASALQVLATLSPAGTPAATVAVLQAARERPLRIALPMGAAGAAAHAVQGLIWPVAGLSYGWFVVLDVVVHAALVAWGAWARTRQELVASLRERLHQAETGQAERVAAARAAARSAERARIAREMHDVLAHRLSLVATSAGALEYRPDAPPERIARAAGVVREGVHQALEELRDVIGVLRADTPVSDGNLPQPELADVAALVGEVTAAGSEVRLTDDTGSAAAPASTGRAAYRIVQECLTNARKHAPGLPVQVDLSGAPGDGLRILVRNALPARPAAAPPGAGTGLVGLAERAEIAGGRLRHGRDQDRFVVTAELPWPA
ncbi:signal transduction histidine kinase [Amycolatopsis endophytica]|uniref:histidine kinase n=1 Tax=Amycolatopsis endophytica TaxID=860233 RepID=A0A853B8V8_9PSEU|nr:histidine kinase [Amycolatopsis endophytica]NYI91450.1 signal transduction histidine kinase [Amycolatopsis endophytica]